MKTHHAGHETGAGSGTTLALAIVFGGAFGFLLQKGGVAKLDILIGVLLLENFVVIKVLGTAILTGMIGFHVLARMGVVERRIGETNARANALGGLVFGVGFGLLGYCPGTAAAALGQGNLDALAGIVGLILGSYLFALSSYWLDAKTKTWRKTAKSTWVDVVRVPEAWFVAGAALLMISILAGIERLGPLR